MAFDDSHQERLSAAPVVFPSPAPERLAILLAQKQPSQGKGVRTLSAIETLGPIKLLTLPETWQKEETQSPDLGTRLLITFRAPRSPTVEISLLYPGRPSGAASCQYLQSLLNEHKDIRVPKILNAQEMKPLAEVMGISTMGDNQYTNSYKPPHPYSPAFKVDKAQLIRLAERPVLAIEGTFVDSKGTERNHCSAIFLPYGKDKNQIYTLFLQAANRGDFLAHKAVFNNALNSLAWTE